MDMMALINSAANFILYCFMSSDFRATLRKLAGLEHKTAKTTVTITTKYEVRLIITNPPTPKPQHLVTEVPGKEEDSGRQG